MKLKQRESRAFWEEQIVKWQKSGLGQATYSRKLGIGRNRFGYWVKKLTPRRLRQEPFVEVRPIPSVNPIFGCELEIPGGIRIRLDRTDSETLKSVLRSVREAIC